jgi:tetratricopeptide (TPR) repeat protein
MKDVREIERLMREGLREHRAGRFVEAARLYEAVLKLDAKHADGLHLLGMVACQGGRPDLAIDMIWRAIGINGEVAAYHSNLGTVLQAQGRLADAAMAYRRALELDAGLAEALGNLGSVLLAQGKRAEAIGCFERAVGLKPKVAELQFHLGHALQMEGRLEAAALRYERALALRPGYAAAHSNLGSVLTELKRWAEAVEHLRVALGIDANLAEAHNGLGSALYGMGELAAAGECYERALALKPEYVEAESNYGTLLEARGELEAAVTRHERALGLRPDYAEAHNSLGNALGSLGRTEEAVGHFERALQLKPELTEAYYNLGIVQLGAGEFAAGWRNYEWRWDARWSPLTKRTFAQPQWKGEPLHGARILIPTEQGLGDTLQFLRYIPMVAAAGGTVVLLVQERMRRLAERLPGVAEIVISGERVPEFAWHCPLLSLPLALGTTLETIPGETPYLSVPAAARLRMEQALAWPEEGLRVGLCWAGNPTFVGDRARHRSLPFEALRPLLERAETHRETRATHFFSLQMGAACAELEGAGWAAGRVTDLAPHVGDMADTAAQMAGLDLVITVDTSVAHLAGALGVETWVLLPFAADWRWLRGRSDSPWYPTMRLFRQPRPGDWEAVVAEVCGALRG